MGNAAVISVFGLERFLLRDDLTAAAGVTSQNGAVPVIRNFVRVTIAADATNGINNAGNKNALVLRASWPRRSRSTSW